MNKPNLFYLEHFKIFKEKYWDFRKEIFSKLYQELDKGNFSLNNEENNKKFIYNKNYKKTIYFEIKGGLKCCKDEKHGIIIKDDEENFIIFITNLKQIKIKNRDDPSNINEEWVCSAHYAIFLLYYVYELVCVFPYFEESSNETKKEDSNEESFYSNDSNKSKISEVSESLSIFDNMEKFLMENKNSEINTQYYINTQKIFNNRFNKNSIIETNEKYLKILYKKKYEFIKNYKFVLNDSKFFNFFINILEIKNTIIHLFRNGNVYEVINIISTLDCLYKECKMKYFYLNMNIWKSINSKRKLKKYIAFSLTNCFDKDGFEKFNIFFSNIREDLDSITDILRNIFNELEKLKNVIIIIEDFDFINLKLFNEGYDKYKKLKFLFIYDISKEINKHFFTKYIYDIIDVTFCYRFLNLDDQNDINWLNFTSSKNDYESLLNINLKSFLEKESFTNLFKIINYKSFYLNEENYFNKNFLINHLDFINLKCENKNNIFKISNIYFKDELIKKIYFLAYNKKLLEFLNQGENIINDVLQKEDGIIFEKGIIYQIMMNKMNIDFEIYDIEKLYCFDINKNLKIKNLKNKNIFFKQVSSKGEKYDCGFLIYNDENSYIKLYQITKNKNQTELNKLKRNILNLDVEYMSNQLEKIGFNKINKFSFGIISNFNLYSNYLNNDNNSNFLELRDFCKNQKYEFLLFNFKDLNFYIEKNHNQMFLTNNNNEINFLKNNEILYSFNENYKLDFLNFPFIKDNLIKKSTKYLDNKNEITNFIIEDNKKNNDKNNIIILGNFINDINNNKNYDIISEINQKNLENKIGILSFGIVNKNELYLNLKYKNININYEKNIKIDNNNQKIEEIKNINNEKFLENIKEKTIKNLNVVVFEFKCEEKFIGKKRRENKEIINLFNMFYKKNKN